MAKGLYVSRITLIFLGHHSSRRKKLAITKVCVEGYFLVNMVISQLIDQLFKRVSGDY